MATHTSLGHPVLDPVLTQLEKLGADYSNVAAKLAAAEGDKDSAVKGFIENSTDAKLVALRDKWNALHDQMKKLAEAALADSALSDEEKAALTKERDALRGKFKDGVIAIRKTAEMLGANTEAVDKALEEIGNPTGSGRGRALGSKGATGPRASVKVWVTNSQGQEIEFKGFSVAAMKFNGETSDFTEAYAKAAGVKLDDIAQVKEPQEFTVQIGDREYKVRTEPKTRGAGKTEGSDTEDSDE